MILYALSWFFYDHELFLLAHEFQIFLPTNFTTLHETCSIILMATWSVARIFTNSIFSAVLGIVRTSSALHSLARKFNKFGCARHYFLRFSAALGNMSKLYCARLHENFCFLLASFEAVGHRPQPQGLRTSKSREALMLGVKTGGVALGIQTKQAVFMAFV